MAAASAAVCVNVLLIGVVVYVRLATELAIPGWATYTTGLLILLLTQILMNCLVITFMPLQSRSSASVIPLRDYRPFVMDSERISP